MAGLRKRGDRYYLRFYSKTQMLLQKVIPIGVISDRTALRLKARLEDQFALGEYDPWEVLQDHSLADSISRFLLTGSHKSDSTLRGHTYILLTRRSKVTLRLTILTPRYWPYLTS